MTDTYLQTIMSIPCWYTNQTRVKPTQFANQSSTPIDRICSILILQELVSWPMTYLHIYQFCHISTEN